MQTVRQSRRVIARAAIGSLLLLCVAAPKVTAATATIPAFEVNVTAKKYAKAGKTGQLLTKITVRGAGSRSARPFIVYKNRYLARVRTSKKFRRTRLYRSSVSFINPGLLAATGHGFRINMRPRSLRRIGVFVEMMPPDAYNRTFTIGRAGCIKRNFRKTACPAGATLPVVNRKGPPVQSGPSYPGGNELTAASTSPGRLTLFTHGKDDRGWARFFSPAGWSSWMSIGDNLASAPSATRTANGQLEVFATGTDGALKHSVYREAQGWQGWSSLGGSLSTGPTAASWGTGRVDVYALDNSRRLVHKFRPGAGAAWSEWRALFDNVFNSAPAAVSWGPSRINVVVRGTLGNFVQTFADISGTEAGNYSVLNDLGGVLLSAPSVASSKVNSLEVYGLNAGYEISERWWDESSWSEWTGQHWAGTKLSTGPATVSWGGERRTDLFARNQNGEILHLFWTASAGWMPVGWENLGK